MLADRWTRRWLVLSGLLVASGLVHLVVLLVGDRSWHGPLSWRKPMTFGLSFGLTLATVVWVTSYVVVRPRLRTWLIGVFAVDCVVEVTGITVQAWRDQPSHLNTSTPANAAIAYTLAAGGAVLIVVLGTFALVAISGRVDGPTDMVLAVRAGFVFLLLGLLSGAAMIARGTVESRLDSPQPGYAAAGFLKDFHGLTLHAVLVLPALAWLLHRRGVAERHRWQAVVSAVAAYVVVTLAVLALDLVRL